jgi:hypothetical protein
MQTDSGKELLSSIELVKKQGGDAVTALRNQLAQSIVAGVITPEEANAIAVDIGLAMKDQSISLNTTASLNTLLGPNGENLEKDPLKIIAEISPKIDVGSISAQASKAFEDLTSLQKVTAMFKNQDRSGEDWKEQFALEEISKKNAAALENEAQARGLLNYEFQTGIINIVEYTDRLKELQIISTKNSSTAGDAQAKILGYKDAKEMKDAAMFYTSKENQVTTARGGIKKATDTGKDAFSLFQEQAKPAKEFLAENFDPEIVKTLTKDLDELSKKDPGIWGKIISGEVKPENVNLNLNVQNSGVSSKEIEDMNIQLQAMQSLPNVSKMIDVTNKALGADDIKELHDYYLEFEKNPDVFKGLNIKDEFTGPLKQAGVAWAEFAAMPNETKFAILTFVQQRLDLTSGKSGEYHGGIDMEIANKQIDDLKAQAAAIAEVFGNEPGPTGGSNGKSKKDKEKELLKMLMERFRLQEMLVDKEAEGYNERVKQLSREIQLEERQVSLRQRSLEELSKKEEAVNDAYNLRADALDKVSESNSRVNEQEKSRISLASALASGDIASAANIAGDMQQQSAQYQIEDARAALEKQRQVDLDSLTVSINGKLMTRKGIEFEIEAIQNRIYNKGIELQGVQDKLVGFEQRKLDIAKEREAVERKMYLTEQASAILALKKLKPSGENKKALADYLASYNAFANLIGVPQLKNYGGSIARMANGGVAYRGSTEAPPAIRMNDGFTVPGNGMTDKVSALLTPGEFVVRKSVADKNRGFLQALNGQVFPGMGSKVGIPKNNFLDGIGSPKYSIPSSGVSNIPVANTNVVSTSSPMYNSTYNVNVNVSGTNASPDDIANVVMAKLSQQNRGNLRSNRY